MRSFSTLMIASLFTVLSLGAQQKIELSSGTILNVREINASFSDPHSMALDPQGFIWVTDRITGNITRMDPSGWSSVVGRVALAADPTNTAIRGGLFGIALDPEFSSGSPYVYLSYTEPNNSLVIARCSFDGVSLGVVEVLKRISNVPCRNGHSMTILADGTLMISVGSWDNSDPSTPGRLTGKVVRMNLDGSAPSDNPFYDAEYPERPSGYVYAYGQRQTAGFAQMPLSHSTLPGVIYSVEPGALSYDEINRVEPGVDYGWHLAAGYCKGEALNTKCPEATFHQTPSSIAFYGSDAIPEWQNSLLVGTISYKGLMVAALSENGSVVNIDPTLPADDVMALDDDHLVPFQFNAEIERIRDVKVSDDGRIYLAVVVVGEQNRGRVIALENPAIHIPLGVDEVAQHSGFRVGPNPVGDVINVTLDTPFAKAWSLRVVDMLGHTVASQQYEKSVVNASVGASQIATGAYMLFLSDGVSTRSTSLVK